jgi:hypothetical protein
MSEPQLEFSAVLNQRSGRTFKGQFVLARKVAHERGRPALHPDWSLDPLHRGRAAPMDEVAAASVDERGIGMASSTHWEVCPEGWLTFSRSLPRGRNNGPPQYISIHQYQSSKTEIRNHYRSTFWQYYVDILPN